MRFVFREILRNKIPKVCFYFSSTERNSELFSFPRNNPEQNFESSLLFFLFHGTQFRAVFSSAKCYGTKSRKFASTVFLFNGTEFRAFSLPRNGSDRNSESFLIRRTAGIPSEITIYFVYPVFFCRILPTLYQGSDSLYLSKSLGIECS